MNILVAPVHVYLNPLYGSEFSWAYNIMKYVSESFPVNFYAICGKAELNRKLKNTAVFEVLSERPVGLFDEALFIFKYYKLATKILKRSRPPIDLIHHIFPLGFKSGFNPLAVLDTLDRRPFIVGPIQFPVKGDITDYAYILNLNLSKVRTKLLYNVNRVFFKVMSKPLLNLHLITLEKANVLIFDSKTTYKLYKELFPGIIRRAKIIPPGVETDFFTFIPPKRKQYLEILATGSLIWSKGFHYLLRAIPELLKEFPNLRVRILGTGPCEGYLKWLTTKLGIERHVTFEGRVNRFDMIKYYASCDIYIARFGVHSILEAQAVGRPVVTSDIGYMPEVISDGVTGYVAPFENVEILKEVISKLLENSELRFKMGIQARSRIEKEFAWSKLANEYYTLYSSLVH